MKKYTFLLALLTLFLPSPITRAAFPDVTAETDYAQAIAWTVEEGITQGYENGNWGPEDCVTRAQLSKMLLEYRLDEKAKLWVEEGLPDFPDVLKSEWHYPYIRYAQFLEIVEGYPSGIFAPDKCVNRVEAMKMGAKSLLPGQSAENSEELYLSGQLQYEGLRMRDVLQGEWYAPFAELFFQEQLVGIQHINRLPICAALGCSSNGAYFYPADPMSRKEVAEMLFRIDQYKIGLPQKTYEIQEEMNESSDKKQSLIEVDTNGNRTILIYDLLGKYKTQFPNLVSFDEIIRGKTKTSEEVILLARYYKNQFLSERLYRLNPNTLELKEFKISSDLNQLFTYRLSPEGNHLIWLSIHQHPAISDEYPNPYQTQTTLYLVDLLNDSYRPLVTLEESKMFKPRDKNTLTLQIGWLDKERIKYAVHQWTEDRVDPFLEYRTASITGPLENTYHSTASNQDFPYFYLEPDSDPEGLFIYLHGAGGGYEQGMSDTNYAGNFKNLKEVLKKNNFVYATPATSGFGESGGKDVVEFMKHMKTHYGDLPIYLSGASAGGSTIFHALNALKDETLNLQGAIFVVPAVSTPMIDAINWGIKAMPVWIEGGENDGVFPPSRVTYFEKALTEKGYPVQSHVIPSGDHNAPVEQINWASVVEYLKNN